MEQQKVGSSSQTLIRAVYEDYETVYRLLQNGVNVNEVDDKGDTALHHATILQRIKIMKLLLKHNARVDIENNQGLKACDMSVMEYEPDVDVINIFLQCKVEIRIFEGMMDRMKKFPENLKNFLYENVSVETVDFSGFSALHLAVRFNDSNAIKTLISRGADVNKYCEYRGATPIYFARSAECIKILLQKGAKPNVKNKYSNSPLLEIAGNYKIEYHHKIIERKEQWRMIEELIRYNANCIEVINMAQELNYRKTPEARCGVEDLLKFMALKEHKYHYVNIDDLMLNQDNVLSSFYSHCLNEVVLLKEKKLSGYVTYYDFVANNINKLSKYVGNESIKKAFKNESELTYMFPIYSEILWGHFKEATEERKLREAACSSLSYAIPCINGDYIAKYKILEFIEIEDMKNIVEAFPLVKLQNNK